MARHERDPAGEKPTKKVWRRGLGGRPRKSVGDAAAEIERKKRRTRAYELRAMGLTHQQISRELQISDKQVRNDIEQAGREFGQESADEHRKVANHRFDTQLARANRAIFAISQLAEGIRNDDGSWKVEPDLEAVSRLDRLLRTAATITRNQALLNGSYAPAVIEHKGEVAIGVPTPAKAREAIRSYFGGNVARPALPEGTADPSDSGEGPPH